MKYLLLSVFAYSLKGVAFLILVSRIGRPPHAALSFAIWVVSWIPLMIAGWLAGEEALPDREDGLRGEPNITGYRGPRKTFFAGRRCLCGNFSRLLRYAAALAVCIGLWGCATPRLGDSEAALVLEDLVAGSTSRLGSRVAAPSVEEVHYPSGGRLFAADLYRSPATQPQTGILLLPGISPAGKDDRRLVALARTLARSGFTVLVPDIPGFRSFRLSPADVSRIADAYEYFSRRRGSGVRTGICAISFALGPAVLAAAQPQTRDRVAFIIGVGGYYDLTQVVTFSTTGYFRGPGAERWERLSPNAYGQALLAMSNAPLLSEASDRRALYRYARDLLLGQTEEEGLIGNVLHLQPEGDALLSLITNRDPKRVIPLMRRLPAAIQTQMRELDPAAQDISRLKARLLLLHGRSDNVIPYTESLALVAAVGPDQARLFMIDGLAHVDLRPKRRDIPVLLEFIEEVLSERSVPASVRDRPDPLP